MQKRELQRSMYELPSDSRAPRLGVAGLGLGCVALAWWLLWAGGAESVASRLGWGWKAGDPVRKGCVAVALAIYYVRMLFTEFVFLRRGMGWSEASTIGPWLCVIFVFLAMEAAGNPHALGTAGVAGVFLFVLGSWMNSYSEYARHKWKKREENRGRLYTEGLFRYSRHPNYLGDLISFSGLCLMTGVWATAMIPVLMLAGFVFVNIPVLDSHLPEHYGSAFAEYATRTRKLIPFVY